MAKALRAWSAKSVGGVRSQLIMARLIVGQFDVTQESRSLLDGEIALCHELKHTILPIVSLSPGRSHVNAPAFVFCAKGT